MSPADIQDFRRNKGAKVGPPGSPHVFPRQSGSPNLLRGYVRVGVWLDNQRVSAFLLLNDIDNMYVDGVRSRGRIATGIHSLAVRCLTCRWSRFEDRKNDLANSHRGRKDHKEGALRWVTSGRAQVSRGNYLAAMYS